MNLVLDKASGCLQATLARRFPALKLPGKGNMPSPPPPSPSVLDREFGLLLKELGLKTAQEESLLALSDERKWLMLCEHRELQEESSGAPSPGSFAEALSSALGALSSSAPRLGDLGGTLESLWISLKSQPLGFLHDFLALKGLALIVELLEAFAGTWSRPEFHAPAALLLLCLKALLNSDAGRSAVLENPAAVSAVVAATDIPNPRAKIAALEILSGLCFVVRRQVLDAFHETFAQRYMNRFMGLVMDLHRGPGTERKEEIRLKTAILALFNALLEDDEDESKGVRERRLGLRWELLSCGLNTERARADFEDSQRMQDHLDLFDMMRVEDEAEWGSDDSGVGPDDDDDEVPPLDAALRRRLRFSTAQTHYVALQRTLLLMPVDGERVEVWRVLSKMVESLMLGLATGAEAEELPLDVVVARLKQDSEVTALEEEHKVAKAQLAKVQGDLDEAQSQISALQDQLKVGRVAGPVTIDVDEKKSGVFQTPPDSPPTPGSPQPPPPSALPPPPPPLPVGGLKGRKSAAAPKRKSVPKPSVGLRTMNWTRLSAEKAGKGTVWAELRDEELYRLLDLRDIEAKFATGLPKSPPMVSGEGEECEKASLWSGTSGCSTDTWRRSSRETELSVMDPRRAQNCTILLSKLRLSPGELRAALLSLDAEGRIPKDAAEQLLKYAPTEAEEEALRSLCETADPALLAPADRFLWELTQLPRHAQRLRALHFRKAFRERLDDLRPQVQTVNAASTSVSESEKLRELLGLVLALGNFLNHGKPNSDAPGFSLSGLLRLEEVKGAGDYTLLHCVVETAERQFPQLLRLRRELGPVFDAARIGGADVDLELRRLREGLGELREELLLHKAEEEAALDGDRFVPVTEAFLAEADSAFELLSKEVADMKANFSTCVRRFGLEAKTTSTDEFFGILGKFLTSFGEVERVLWKRREEEERRAKTAAWNATLGTQSRKSAQRLLPAAAAADAASDAPGDFDRLVQALQSGQIYEGQLSRLRASFRVPKRRKEVEKSSNRKSVEWISQNAASASRDRS